MTIYGSEFEFPKPDNMDAMAFGDAFDNAIASLTEADGFFSIDAIQSLDGIKLLVGVDVPDTDDSKEFFSSRINELLMPALASAGLISAPLTTVKGTTARVFA